MSQPLQEFSYDVDGLELEKRPWFGRCLAVASLAVEIDMLVVVYAKALCIYAADARMLEVHSLLGWKYIQDGMLSSSHVYLYCSTHDDQIWIVRWGFV